MDERAAGTAPPGTGLRVRAQTLLLAAFFLASGAALTTPVADPDFWWHLASGRWMWERGALMSADPFSFTSAAFPASGGGYAFAQYWLAELLHYGIHAAFGLTGVILLRAAAFTLLFFLLHRLLRALGAGVLAATLLVALAFRAIVHELGYIGDRPQMWSSLFFVAALLLRQRQREGWRPAFAVLPLLMLLWSNLHGGYLMGLAVVGLSAAADAVSGCGTRRGLVSTVAAFLLSGCNPAGFSVLVSYPAALAPRLGGGTGILEEHSLLDWVSLSTAPRLVPAVAAILALSLLTLLPRARAAARERPDLLALYFLALVMGAMSARFVVFLVVVAAALAAANGAALLQGRRDGLAGRVRGDGSDAVRSAAAALALVGLTALQLAFAARASALRPGAAYRHPYERAADFLKGSSLQGNLFNEYGAGGYLAWRLYPSLRVFIYGRMLSPDLLGLYEDLLLNPSGTRTGRRGYREELDVLDVDALVLPSCNPTSGIILPLTVRVARDERWALVYSDATAVVLVRRAKAPVSLLAETLPPGALYDNMIAVAERAGRTRHGRAMPAWRYSLAFARYAKGERAAALTILDEYLKLAPNHLEAWRIRERIRGEIGAGSAAPSPPAWADGGDGTWR